MRGVRGCLAALALASLCLSAHDARAARNDWAWAKEASSSDIAAAAPEVARSGVFSQGVVRCSVENDGNLVGCRVVSETPIGSGVGDAVLSLTPKFRREPPGKDDLREVNVVVGWSNIDKPADWRRRPSAEDLLAVFPREAFRREVSGYAVISCVVTVQGALNDCVVIDESPAGMGFGGAAIALTPQFTMKPALLRGEPVISTARFPIRFGAVGGGLAAAGKKVLPANISWSEAPTFADMAAAYPSRAREEGIGGRAMLACRMDRDGRLTGCSVAASSPVGYGFDRAAKALAKKFAYPVTTDEDRKAVREVIVHLPITFDPAMIDQAESVVGKPTWVAVPRREQLLAAFADLSVTDTARVMMRCMVQPGGSLSGCSVVSEAPTGASVGAAALTLVPGFRLSTWTTEGLPVVGGTVTIPLRYEPDQPAAPAVPAAQ